MIIRIIAIFILTYLLVGCSGTNKLMPGVSNKITNVQDALDNIELASSVLSDAVPEDEYILGVMIAKKIIDSVPYSPDSMISIYTNSILQTLLKNSKTPYIYNGYKLIVLKNKEFNAYALPGGIIVLHDGLLKKVYNEDQLASIIAHEIGHIEGMHFSQDISNDNYMKIAKYAKKHLQKKQSSGNSLVNKVANDFVEKTFTQLSNNILNGYSVEYEAEADQIALRLLKDAGYENNSLKQVLSNLNKKHNVQKYAGAKYPKNRIELIEKSSIFSNKIFSRKNIKIREKRFDKIKYISKKH